MAEPILNWQGKLRHWLDKNQASGGRGASPPHHWTTYGGSPRCAVCGTRLGANDPPHTPRTPPACSEHASDVDTFVEQHRSASC